MFCMALRRSVPFAELVGDRGETAQLVGEMRPDTTE
jgi:hypothetical protein